MKCHGFSGWTEKFVVNKIPPKTRTITYIIQGISADIRELIGIDDTYFNIHLFDCNDETCQTGTYQDGYNDGKQAGIDECKGNPTSCGITPDPKDGSTQAGIDKCKADPTSCGITPDPEDGSTQAGIDKCKADPASCGIVNASATYEPQLGEVHIPLIEVPGAFETIQKFDVYLMQRSNTFTFDLDMDRITLK